MTQSIFDRIGVSPFPNKRVLWSRIQKRVEGKVIPQWVGRLLNLLLVVFWVYQLSTTDMWKSWTSILGWTVFLAVIVVTIKFAPAILKRLHLNTEQTDFMSCIITTDRILLLDYEGAPVTALDRRSLKPAFVDFVRGGRAIIFRSNTDPRDHAFIANTDFKPALAALDTTGIPHE